MPYGMETVKTFGGGAVPTADSWTATGDDTAIFDVTRPITVKRIGATVKTATVSSGNIIIDFDKRVLTGSDTGRVTSGVGRLTIPTAIAAGKVMYKDITPVDLNVGDQVIVTVTTAAAGGGAAGGGTYFFEFIDRHETMANQTDAVASV